MKMLKKKKLTKLQLNNYDGMSILHHCTASYQRRYHVLLYFIVVYHIILYDIIRYDIL